MDTELRAVRGRQVRSGSPTTVETTSRAGIEYLRTTTRELDLLATVELVIDCSALTRCEVALARVLAGLRRRRLEAGTRVELHAVPRELAREIGPGTR